MSDDYKKFESNDMIGKYVGKLTELTVELNRKLALLKDEFSKDNTPIDETNLIGDQNKLINLQQKYIFKYIDEKNTLSKIERSMNKLYAELYDYYRFYWDKSTKLTDSAVKTFIEAHKCYEALSEYLDLAKNITNLISDFLDVLRNKNFAIKNCIEIRKIQLGLN